MRLIDADVLNRRNVNCANVPMNFIDTAPTVEAIPKSDVIDIFKKIKVEIENEKHIGFTPQDFADGLDLALEIIDKHIKNEVNHEIDN